MNKKFNSTYKYNSTYRYDKFIFQIHQAIISMMNQKDINKEEQRRLILIDEFIKLVAHANNINYDRCNLFMKLDFEKRKLNKSIKI